MKTRQIDPHAFLIIKKLGDFLFAAVAGIVRKDSSNTISKVKPDARVIEFTHFYKDCLKK